MTSCKLTWIYSHVTKSGDVAGPKMLEHLVDVVLYFDGDSSTSEVRWLHCHKNRFGPNEVGVFQLMDNGLVPLSENSLSFVSSHPNGEVPQGVAWCVTSQGGQGSRFVVAEVQALTNTVHMFGSEGGGMVMRPRKTKSSGVSLERIEWLTAVIAKHVIGGKVLNQSDLFINVVGGLFSNDRGNDLAFAIAMASSALGKELIWPKKGSRVGIALVGEIGLTGDVRPANSMWSRINSASKSGLAKIVVSQRWWKEHRTERKSDIDDDIDILPVESLNEAVTLCLVGEDHTLSKPKASKARSK
jgi:DNA repair protein RadA/Sms